MLTDPNFPQDPLWRNRSRSPVRSGIGQGDQGIANLVIITGLPMADDHIQIQALEVNSLLIMALPMSVNVVSSFCGLGGSSRILLSMQHRKCLLSYSLITLVAHA
jgi:hypothetical protein